MKLDFENMKSGDKFKSRAGVIYVLIQLPFVDSWILVSENGEHHWCGPHKNQEGAFGGSPFEPYYPILDQLKDGSVLEYVGDNEYVDPGKTTLCFIPGIKQWTLVLHRTHLCRTAATIQEAIEAWGFSPNDFALVK